MQLTVKNIFDMIEDAEYEYQNDPEMNNEQKHWILARMIRGQLMLGGPEMEPNTPQVFYTDKTEDVEKLSKQLEAALKWLPGLLRHMRAKNDPRALQLTNDIATMRKVLKEIKGKIND